MSHSVICYAQPDKSKSRLVLEAFAAGCGGRMASTEALVLEPGDVAFYGVRPAWAGLWRQAKAEGRDWYYIDNAAFDADREIRYRVGKNVVQQSEFQDAAEAAPGRLTAPWRVRGEHVVLCPQSDEFMRTVCAWTRNWTETVCSDLRRYTTRELRVRRKGERRPLADDLVNAWALVTHSSAAANEALLAGVPVFVTGPCAATSMALSDLSRIEYPAMPDGRERWAAAVSARQWTLEQLRDGTAWKLLNE